MLSRSTLQPLLLTSRPEAAERFYCDVLGLALLKKTPRALVFAVGGAELRVCPVASTEPGEHTVMGFAVEDIARVIRQLGEGGVSFERFAGFPHNDDGAVKTPEGDIVAWFRDPDGNLLSVVQYAPPGD